MFSFDGWAVGLVVAFLFMIFLFRRGKQRIYPSLFFSDLSAFRTLPTTWRVRRALLPDQLKKVAFFFLLLAFLDFHLLIDRHDAEKGKTTEESGGRDDPIEEVALPSEGIAIYLVLDQSGSMKQLITVENREGRYQRISRMDYLKRVTRDFLMGSGDSGLLGRENDLIGLVGFARVAHVLSPLTLQHDYLLEQLAKMSTVSRQDEEGTSLGYAVYKTANMIAATQQFSRELAEKGESAYEVKSRVMLLVTDGLPVTNPLDYGHQYRTIPLLDAAAFAKEHDIRLYIVNIEPQILQRDLKVERESLQYSAEMTGGKFYVANDAEALIDIYREIDQLEKTALPQEKKIQAFIEKEESSPKTARSYRGYSFYPLFISVALSALFVSLLLETTLMRRVP